MTDTDHTPNATTSPRSAHRRRRLAAVLTAAICAASVPAATPASAQAVPVSVVVRTSPERPVPGDDVDVLVTVEGCPVGPITAEVYLETADGAKRSAVRIARAAVDTSVTMRSTGAVRLPDAFEGWYGVRVLCGTFRPPRRSMTATLFHVRSSEAMTLQAPEVQSLSDAFTMSGQRCPGGTVEWMVNSGFGGTTPFDPDGTVLVDDSGTWTVNAPWPEAITLGPMRASARCGYGLDTMTPRYLYYQPRWDLTAAP
ncbi:MAG TPA: hypothetical protein PLP95_05870 [Microthrixaceae bacterium]|nr:hypothetical protein [Microthrixaceae bacterium]